MYMYMYMYIHKKMFCACAIREPGQSSPLCAWALLALLQSLWACGAKGGQRERGRKEEKEPREGGEKGEGQKPAAYKATCPPWHVNTCPPRAAAHFRPGSGVFKDLRRGSGVGEEGWCTLRNRRPLDVQL